MKKKVKKINIYEFYEDWRCRNALTLVRESRKKEEKANSKLYFGRKKMECEK